MSALGPRPTEPEAWQGWLREAAGLLVRRPAAFLGYTAGVAAALLLAHSVAWAPLRGLLTLLVVVLALVLFVRLALVADYNRDARPFYVLPGNLDGAVALTAGAGLFAAYGALGPLLFWPLADSLETVLTGVGLYEERLASGAPAPPPQEAFAIGPVFVAGGVWALAAVGALAGLLAFGQWFLLPMVALHGAHPGMAMWMSVHAYAVNPVSMTGLLGLLLAAVGVVVLTVGWLGVLLLPVFGAVLYTSYRDVFLARAENHPPGVPVLTEAELLDQPDDSV
ncbi:hypothetical protein [Halorhodospira halophila]|uniref:Transmembrane protein n=1 Tax=Halorhodospira halophila (strain DSM 244 / SL1) TaxID=349124 RepID=A1WTF9_HALHL|nr:hypothetical protein [Halorhodospira halophila]ABM60971.1 conserved hypothetical protein [Halorhodospira halophila SL1]MBK1728629.1 hypothetical protein [Halorhodospira halophila]